MINRIKIETIRKAAFFFLLLTIFLIPIYFIRFQLLFLPTNLLEISIFITVFLSIVYLFISKKKINFGSILLYLFLFAALVAAFFAEDKITALGIFKGWFLVPVLFYLCVINLVSPKNIRKILIPLFISLVLISIWAILQHFKLIGTSFYQKGDPSFAPYLLENRAFGPFESPNFLAMFIVPIFFIILPLFQYLKPMYLKIAFVCLSLIPIFALIFSGSKGGMIAFFASWIVAAAYMLLSRKQHGIKLSTKYAFFIIGFVALIGSAFAVNKVDLISGGNAVRKEIYHYSIEMVKSSWLMGVGLGSFQNKIGEISANNLAFQMYGMPFALHPHNLFLAVWLNLGLLGMAVFISILVWFYFGSATIKDNNVKFSLVAAMSSILIHGLFDTTYFKNDLSMIFMIIISILAISRFHEKNN